VKIKSKILIQKIEKQDYLQDLESIKYSDITNAKLKTIAQKMIQEVIQASKNNSLLQTE
jgi:DNA-binding protein Fis